MMSVRQLWGFAEQKKRLRMLIVLGYPSQASQGFTTCQADVIKRALRCVYVCVHVCVYVCVY